ncbi:MCE family protein [Amycolatopsis nigrescens]|uniref:MCE family protein n=1 Tax=Amycolatopsis nigrescens TaxID=381445 RepID=UPI00035F0805|nr:MCE family protein [Amycolatopsis nigrescens]
MKKLLFPIMAALAGLLTASGCTVFTEPVITVTAQFRDSVGLFPGNDVAMLGIPVGRVTGIEPRGTHVVVAMELKAGIKIPATAGAVTVSPSVVTDRHVELTPVYSGGPVLRDGDLIPLERTKTPVEIDRVIKAVDELAAQLSKTDGGTGVLKDATDVGAQNLAGNGDRLRETFQALAGAVDSGSGQRDALVGLVKNVDSLLGAAAENDATIRSFSTGLTEASELFAAQAPELGAALQTLNDLLDETTTLVDENRTTIRDSLAKLRTTTGTLAEHGRELAESADVLPLLFQNVTSAVDPATGQLRVHADPAEIILDTELLNGACKALGLNLPGCRSGKVAEFGPDLGMTELLLGAAK